jgi:hypothetical protein
MEKAIIKFNGGKLAILCHSCRAIIKEGAEFTQEEKKYAKGELRYISPQYCVKCMLTRN